MSGQCSGLISIGPWNTSHMLKMFTDRRADRRANARLTRIIKIAHLCFGELKSITHYWWVNFKDRKGVSFSNLLFFFYIWATLYLFVQGLRLMENRNLLSCEKRLSNIKQYWGFFLNLIHRLKSLVIEIIFILERI